MNPACLAILDNLAAAAEYREPRDPFKWTEEERVILDDKGHPIRFDWGYDPSWEEPFRELMNPDNESVVFMCYSRWGKTMLFTTGVGYCIAEEPRRIGIMYPTTGQVEKFSKRELQTELIDTTPQLRALFGDGGNRRDRANTILHKHFPGGELNLVGANAPGEIRRLIASLLVSDEEDAIVSHTEAAQQEEGDQVSLFTKRGSQFPDTLRWRASYPGLWGRSRIARAYAESDQRRRYVHCLKCGDPWVMRRVDHLRIDYEKPENTRIECPHCGDLVGETGREKMVAHGYWEATNAGIDRRPGFHISSLYWRHAVNRKLYPGGYLEVLARAMLKAEDSEDSERQRRVLVNTEDAEPYKPPAMDVPEPETLLSRCSDYHPDIELPAGVLLITAGIDVQGNRLEAEVVGHGLGFREWGLGYYVLKGDPKTKALEDKLDALLARKFKHPVLGEMEIDRAGMDCGYETDWVMSLTLTRPKLRAVRGMANLASKAIHALKSEAFHWEGSTRRAKLYQLGVNHIKRQIYERLKVQPTEENKGAMFYPKGYGYDAKYFAGLTMEVPREKQSPDGNWQLSFETKAKGNEPFDARVYAKAMAATLMKTMRTRGKKATTEPEAPAKVGQKRDDPPARVQVSGAEKIL